MFFKLSLFVFMLALCILYLKQTETFYLICDKITKNNFTFENHINADNDKTFLNEDSHSTKKEEKFIKVLSLCKEFNMDYSTHKFMKYTLKVLDDFIYNTASDNSDEELYLDGDGIKYQVDMLDLNSFKFKLYATKFIHIFMYSIIIYISIVSIPNILAKMALYFVNKVLYVIFFVLLAEAFLKICFQVDSDIVTLLVGGRSDDVSGLTLSYVKQLVDWLAYPLKFLKAII